MLDFLKRLLSPEPEIPTHWIGARAVGADGCGLMLLVPRGTSLTPDEVKHWEGVLLGMIGPSPDGSRTTAAALPHLFQLVPFDPPSYREVPDPPKEAA